MAFAAIAAAEATVDEALDILLTLDLNQDDIDAIKLSVHHAVANGHINPIDAAIILSALNNY